MLIFILILILHTKNYHDSLLKVISRENAPTSNPFAAAPDSGPEETPNILDLFGVGGGQADTVGVWVASVYNLQDSRMFIWIELMISLLTMHTGPRCPKRWPSATSRKSFCQHDEWWAMLMQCIGTEQGCWYCWHHYFVLSLLTSSREPKRKTFHSSGLGGSPREFLCPSSCFQLRPSCRWVLFVSNQPGWVKRDHEKLRSKSILIFLEASPPHLHLHFSAPPLLP